MDGVERGSLEGGVMGEGLARVHTHDLKAEDLLLELEGKILVRQGEGLNLKWGFDGFGEQG